MIHFHYVKYKNILSTGNAWTHIQLDNNKSTLIVGENGAGKSTMLDAICFALYGKPFRKINKPQLMNSINNKELLVELNFTIGRNKFTIKRGIKPNIFEIWKNNELLNQDAASKDYQAYLEESILKLNLKSFGQVVVLGSSTFVPFMQLPAQQRREVIEDLLDIQIFSTMNVLLKEHLTTNKSHITEIKHDIDMLEQKIESAKEHNASIKKMKEVEVTKLKEKLKDNIAYIEVEQEKIDALVDEVTEMVKSIADKQKTKDKIQEIKDLDRELSNKLKSLHKEISFYTEHDNCPTCKQGIEHEFKSQTIEGHTANGAKIEEARKDLSSRLVSLEQRYAEIDTVESKITSKHLLISEHKANHKLAMTSCKNIKVELEQAEKEVEEVDDSKIKQLSSELQQKQTAQQEAVEHREIIGVAANILKDGGIKTRIVKQYIPVMNKLINKYLAAMDFFVDFQLDENFNETIKSRFRDTFSYSSFSEGEKLRIDLSLLFTWRAVAKLRNSVSTNLLVMDEIMDSSLDSAGTEEFLKIINEITQDSNVFIISHKGDQLFDKFDNVIKFEKVKNFSRIQQ